jgi:hypothetical protein
LRKAREDSLRVQCASNLRQVGLVESMYANENHGYLILRDVRHGGVINHLTRVGAGCIAIDLGQYTSPQIWFCPEFFRGQSGKDQWTNADRQLSASMHRMGYGFYCANWDGSRPQLSDPSFGPIVNYINDTAAKLTDLQPWQVLASEYYSIHTNFYNDPTGQWHLGKNALPEGGNMLLGDGSVQWSTNVYNFYDGALYTMPAGLH